MIILLTNDDGYEAPGIIELQKALSLKHDVYTVAPNRQKSASSRSITIDHPIFYNQIAPKSYVVEGTPVDCVTLGFLGLIPDVKFDLIVSGINSYPNLGDDVSYSGTAGAALEAEKFGMPGIAFSCGQACESPMYDKIAFSARKTIDHLQKMSLLTPRNIFNVNIPNIEHEKLEGIQFTFLGKRIYEDKLDFRKSPFGRKYVWLDGVLSEKAEPGNDFHAVNNNYVSVTPVKVHCDDHELREKISEKEMDWIV